MATEVEVEDQVASLKRLLDSRLPAEDALEFGASDLRLLVRKGYHTERRLRQATVEKLQGPPGEAVQPFLIDILLKAFNPAAQQQGSSTSAKHTASVCTAPFLLQFAPSALLPNAANTRTPSQDPGQKSVVLADSRLAAVRFGYCWQACLTRSQTAAGAGARSRAASAVLCNTDRAAALLAEVTAVLLFYAAALLS